MVTENTKPLGIVLGIGFLLFDSLTSVTQERLYQGYDMSSSNQLFFVSMFSCLLSFTSTKLFFFRGGLITGVASARLLGEIDSRGAICHDASIRSRRHGRPIPDVNIR